jgi:hypothetical protein
MSLKKMGPNKKQGIIYHSREITDLIEIKGCVLAMLHMSNQAMYAKSNRVIGCFVIPFGKIEFCNCVNNSKIINPKRMGSVGIKSPNWFVYSSILMDKGVKNARDKKRLEV